MVSTTVIVVGGVVGVVAIGGVAYLLMSGSSSDTPTKTPKQGSQYGPPDTRSDAAIAVSNMAKTQAEQKEALGLKPQDPLPPQFSTSGQVNATKIPVPVIDPKTNQPAVDPVTKKPIVTQMTRCEMLQKAYEDAYTAKPASVDYRFQYLDWMRECILPKGAPVGVCNRLMSAQQKDRSLPDIYTSFGCAKVVDDQKYFQASFSNPMARKSGWDDNLWNQVQKYDALYSQNPSGVTSWRNAYLGIMASNAKGNKGPIVRNYCLRLGLVDPQWAEADSCPQALKTYTSD